MERRACLFTNEGNPCPDSFMLTLSLVLKIMVFPEFRQMLFHEIITGIVFCARGESPTFQEGIPYFSVGKSHFLMRRAPA
jgi:hypothetical protein